MTLPDVKTSLLKIQVYLRSNLFQACIEFVAFLCFIVMLLAIMLHPEEPDSLRPLKGMIHIPATLSEIIDLNSLPIHNKKHYTTFQDGEYNHYVLMAFMIASILALKLKKYFFHILLFTLTIFPWRKIGYDQNYINTLSTLYVTYWLYILINKKIKSEVILFIFKRWIFFPAILIPGIIITVNLVPWILSSSLKSQYISAYKNPNSSINKGAHENTQKKAAILAGIQALADAPVKTKQQQQAQAYVMAQHAALSGDAAGAANWLKRLPLTPDLTDGVVAERLATVERYTVSQGISGQEARQKLYLQYQHDKARNMAIGIVALLLALVLPSAVPVIITYMRKIRQERNIGVRAVNAPASLPRDNKAREKLIQYNNSTANRNPEDELNNINKQLTVQFYLAFICFFTGLFFYTYYMNLALPSESSNNAFRLVSLPQSANSYWDSYKILNSKAGMDNFSDFHSYFLKSILMFFLGIIVLIVPIPEKLKEIRTSLFKNKRVSLYGWLGIFFIFYTQSIAFKPEDESSIPPSKITVEMRHELAAAAANSGTPTQSIDASAAAYTLAQIAYIEGSPDNAGLFLDKITDFEKIKYENYLQRLEIIKAWVISQNVNTSIKIPEREGYSIKTLRKLSFYALMITITASVFLFIIALLMREKYQRRTHLIKQITSGKTSR